MGRTNRLAQEKSPYLLQHASNPVDWYPWGEEAFARARAEDKPILLSIGYSTCHWCHVMERESFSDPRIAQAMNRALVNVKLDREERPDLDRIYMTAVTAMTGQGGWPLNVFLTPDLQPFFGGTYFPPEDRWGRLGWPQLVQRIGEAWQDPEERKKILQHSRDLTEHLRSYLTGPYEPADPAPDILETAFRSFRQDYDDRLGGFGPAPKFPMPVNHHFLLAYSLRGAREAAEAGEARRMSLRTLSAMRRGGIHDHLGGGFARYSTDESWHVPHFEKMLYDNAQIAVNYLDAFCLERDPSHLEAARACLDFMLRDMRHPQGGFYSAYDADSLAPGSAGGAGSHPRKEEGAFYVWKKSEVLEVLGAEAGGIFCRRYGVKEEGNAASDPHGEFTGKNILFEAESLEEAAGGSGRGAAETEALLRRARAQLFAARARRPAPHLDDKVLTAWNGLAVSACARGFQVTGDGRYLEAAQSAALFLRERLWDRETGLYRRWRDGERKIAAVADDYAFLVQGLLDLYESDFDLGRLRWALDLNDRFLADFYDAEKGGFFFTSRAQNPGLILRGKDDSDNVEPSANSIAVSNCLRLAQMTGREDAAEAARKTLRLYAPRMRAQPRALPRMAANVGIALASPCQVVVRGDPACETVRGFLREIYGRLIPGRVLLLVYGGEAEAFFARHFPFLAESETRPSVRVCANFACRLPARDLDGLRRALDGGPGS